MNTNRVSVLLTIPVEVEKGGWLKDRFHEDCWYSGHINIGQKYDVRFGLEIVILATYCGKREEKRANIVIVLGLRVEIFANLNGKKKSEIQ